jgi:Flp pilus assembly pilin Flp
MRLRRARDDRGAGLVEYALLVALCAIPSITAVDYLVATGGDVAQDSAAQIGDTQRGATVDLNTTTTYGGGGASTTLAPVVTTTAPAPTTTTQAPTTTTTQAPTTTTTAPAPSPVVSAVTKSCSTYEPWKCTVSVNATVTGGGTLTYAWTDNGAAVGTTNPLTRTFTSAGSHTVKVTVTSSAGKTSTSQTTVTCTQQSYQGYPYLDCD